MCDIVFVDQYVSYLIVVDSIDVLLYDGRQCTWLDMRVHEYYYTDIFETGHLTVVK